MEAARRGPRAGVGSRALLLALLLHGAMGAEAEEPRPPRQRGDEQCHYYAGGQVYPGEAARVPVTDHSLHLSQAKSRCGADGRERDAPGRGAELGAAGGGRGGRDTGAATSGRALGAGQDGRGIFCALVRVRNTERPPRPLALPVSLHVTSAAAKRAVIGVPAVGEGFGWPPASVPLCPSFLGCTSRSGGGLGDPALVEQKAQRHPLELIFAMRAHAVRSVPCSKAGRSFHFKRYSANAVRMGSQSIRSCDLANIYPISRRLLLNRLYFHVTLNCKWFFMPPG